MVSSRSVNEPIAALSFVFLEIAGFTPFRKKSMTEGPLPSLFCSTFFTTISVNRFRLPSLLVAPWLAVDTSLNSEEKRKALFVRSKASLVQQSGRSEDDDAKKWRKTKKEEGKILTDFKIFPSFLPSSHNKTYFFSSKNTFFLFPKMERDSTKYLLLLFSNARFFIFHNVQ